MTIRFLAAMLVACAPALGQNVSSSVHGTLLDPTGASVPGATCTLTNQATAAVLTAASGADGSFVFPNVQAGAYNLTVTISGFKTLETTNIVVTASEIRALAGLTLELGEVRETVSVPANPASIQLASAERSGVITGSQLNDIAVRGRDFFALLLTVPGVVDNFSQGRETMSPNSLRGTFINGGRDNQKNFTVDGITDLDTGSNGSVHFQPNMDAISEIKIMTSNYQAEFGRNSGGVITVITRGGSKDLHGTAYDFYRHESLNANNFFNNKSNTPKSPYRYRITGYSVGGPVFVPNKFNRNRDKLFFFWSQEYTGTKKDFGTRYGYMPTQLERQGDFSQSKDLNGRLIQVKDPLSGGGPFPGNIIPRSRINKLGQAILNFFPLPNYSEADPNLMYRRNFRVAESGPYPKRQDMIRIDANLWPSFQVYYRFIRDKDQQDTPGTIMYALTGMRTGLPGKGHVVHMTRIFSPTLVNEFIFGKSYNRVYFDLLDKQAVDRSGMGNPPQWFAGARPSANYIPDVTFGGQPAAAVSVSLGMAPFENWNEIYSFVNNISKVWGAHTLKAGIYIERTGKFQPGGSNYRGEFRFNRETNNPFDSNHSYANALLGHFLSYSEATARVDGNYWFWNADWFVQDNWKLTRRLTLDLGLRFHHMPPMEDLNRNISTWDPKFYNLAKAPELYAPAIDPVTGKRVAKDPMTGKLESSDVLIGMFVPGSGDYANGMVVGGKNAYPPGLYTTGWLNLGPRLGFAYDLFGNGKTALRGGFGMFKDRPQGNPTMNTNGNPPVVYTPWLYYGRLDTYAQTAGAVGPSSLRTLLGDNKMATTMNFSLGIQRRIRNTNVDLAYVGGLSRHLIVLRNLNPIPMFARFDPKNDDPTQPGKALTDNFLRPIKGYGDINLQEFAATSNYNALQVAANRRFTHGLQFGWAYTWSKTLGVSPDDYSNVSPYFSPRKWNYGRLAYDRPHVFVFNYMYELPKAGRRLGFKPAGWVLDNWAITGVTAFMSGAPYTPTQDVAGQDISGSSEPARITVVGNPNLPKSERTFYRNFNPGAFARTATGSFGNAGVGMLTGPGVNSWNLAISKKVPLWSEARFIQFRTEMFNAFNRTQFSSVDSILRFDPQGRNTNLNVGAYATARAPRIIQLSLKVFF